MQFCLDKEPKCPENRQLLDFISSTAQCSSCNTYIINKLRCITNKVKCITNCLVKCNFVWTKSQNVRKRGNCWTLFQALHSVAPTLPIRSGGTVGITISSTAQCSSCNTYIINKLRCITNKVKCITNCLVKCNFVWTKSQNVRKRGNCWTLFQALHSVAPTLPIRSGGTVGITISSTAQYSSCNTYIINKLRCITNKVKCITNCPVKCNFVWTKSQNVRKIGICWTLFQALHSVAPTLPIRSGDTVGITILSTAQCSSCNTYIINKLRCITNKVKCITNCPVKCNFV